MRADTNEEENKHNDKACKLYILCISTFLLKKYISRETIWLNFLYQYLQQIDT